MQIKPIGYIKSNYKSKFGIPRQSGIVEEKGYIVLEKEFQNPDAFRGIEEFSHLWILWGFSECIKKQWSPTVRPPKLGGNKRMGVFATRSPYRPNSIGLSSVKLVSIDYSCVNAPVICICGADMLDGTPVYDIKPYLPYTDCHTEAVGGFADCISNTVLDVSFDCEHNLDDKVLLNIVSVLQNDPRPSYQNDCQRIYGMDYGDLNIKFKVDGSKLTVTQITVTQMK